MWGSFRLTFSATLITAASFFLVALASNCALARSQVDRLDADLASVIQADYSVDLRGTWLAPLGEGIVDAARRDESRLQETTSEVEIVPVFRVQVPTNPEAGGEAPPTATATATPGLPSGRTASGTPAPSATGSAAAPLSTSMPLPTQQPGPSPKPGFTPTPEATATPGPMPTPPLTPGPTPTPGPSPKPGPSPTPTPTSTPVPAPTPTPTPPASPTPTPTPPPTLTPTPTATPTATPLPQGYLTFYLHNNPTPPTGDTASQPVLPMNLIEPNADTLYNYDTDRDAFPGLLIAKGGGGADEADPTKYQAWRTPAFAADLVVQGDLTLKLWSAMKDFQRDNGAAVTVYLRDFDGSGYVELGSSTFADPAWQGGSPSWVLKTLTFSVGPHTVASGHSLELKIIVEGSSDDDMWFAYDTSPNRSRVVVPSLG